MAAPYASPPGLDILDWFIATLHQMIGHDKTAAVLAQPAGDQAECVLCRFERREVDSYAVMVAFARAHSR